MADVIAFAKNQLADADRKRLTAAGVVFVEIDDPAAMHGISTTTLTQSVIDGDAIVRAALTALNCKSYESAHQVFTRELFLSLPPKATGGAARATEGSATDAAECTCAAKDMPFGRCCKAGSA